MNERLLIAEDDADMRDLLQEDLESAGYEIVIAVDGTAALEHIRREQKPIDLVITDVQMPDLKGDELLQTLREQRAEIPVIVITAFGSVEQAVQMIKAGAFQYLTKPFESGDLLRLVAAALAKSAPQREQARLRRELPAAPTQIIGASRPMRELFELIARAARNTSTVLIAGQSGTGKELVARAIHQASGRRGAFVPVTPGKPSPEQGRRGQAFLKLPTEERYFWMKSATCLFPYSRNCFASFKRERFGEWGRIANAKSRCEPSLPPTATWKTTCAPDVFAKTSSGG
jgi:DNA-binding NtrC family response regulator